MLSEAGQVNQGGHREPSRSSAFGLLLLNQFTTSSSAEALSSGENLLKGTGMPVTCANP